MSGPSCVRPSPHPPSSPSLTFAPSLSPTAGFINAVSPSPIGVAEGWTHVYQLSWPLGFSLSFFTHVLLSHFFPPTGLGEVDDEDVFGTFTEGAGAGLAYDPSADSDSASDVKDGKAASVTVV